MAKKLFVGNLDYTVTTDELKAFFEAVGSVLSVAIPTDRETGRSRGFGFVEMEDADAVKAIEKLNGQDLKGRKVNVNEARPQENR